MSQVAPIEECPSEVSDLAQRAVAYVETALGVTLEWNSETLPVLDHYLRSVPDESPEAAELIAACAGAYFGEVVRRRLGGQWETVSSEAHEWKLVLPGGLWFQPAHVVLATVHQSDDYKDNINPPTKMVEAAESALGRMADVTASDYYSLCGRFDALEHLQSVLLAIAVQEAERRENAN